MTRIRSLEANQTDSRVQEHPAATKKATERVAGKYTEVEPLIRRS